MLTIRPAQMQVFAQRLLPDVEKDLLLHLQESFPKHCAALGSDAVRAHVGNGATSARQYGLTLRGPVRLYLELTFIFGSRFATDSQYPWASAALEGEPGGEEMERANKLYAGYRDYHTKVSGENSEWAVAALRRTLAVPLEAFPRLGSGFESAALQHLQEIYPQKFQFVGVPALQKLVQGCTASARECAPDSTVAAALFAGLAFGMGHGFLDDPLYPWVNRTLREGDTPYSAAGIERLHRRAVTYLREAVEGT